jgi:hypothetical protein
MESVRNKPTLLQNTQRNIFGMSGDFKYNGFWETNLKCFRLSEDMAVIVDLFNSSEKIQNFRGIKRETLVESFSDLACGRSGEIIIKISTNQKPEQQSSISNRSSIECVDRGFEPRWKGETKDYKIGICCFSQGFV